MTSTTQTKRPIDRAIENESKDRSLADELLEGARLQELHTLCSRMIAERAAIAKGFVAMVESWALMKAESGQPQNEDAIVAIERVASEAIAFAREVVQALTNKPKSR